MALAKDTAAFVTAMDAGDVSEASRRLSTLGAAAAAGYSEAARLALLRDAAFCRRLRATLDSDDDRLVCSGLVALLQLLTGDGKEAGDALAADPSFAGPARFVDATLRRFSREPPVCAAALHVARCFATSPSAALRAKVNAAALLPLCALAIHRQESARVAAVAAICNLASSSEELRETLEGADAGLVLLPALREALREGRQNHVLRLANADAVVNAMTAYSDNAELAAFGLEGLSQLCDPYLAEDGLYIVIRSNLRILVKVAMRHMRRHEVAAAACAVLTKFCDESNDDDEAAPAWAAGVLGVGIAALAAHSTSEATVVAACELLDGLCSTPERCAAATVAAIVPALSAAITAHSGASTAAAGQLLLCLCARGGEDVCKAIVGAGGCMDVLEHLPALFRGPRAENGRDDVDLLRSLLRNSAAFRDAFATPEAVASLLRWLGWARAGAGAAVNREGSENDIRAASTVCQLLRAACLDCPGVDMSPLRRALVNGGALEALSAAARRSLLRRQIIVEVEGVLMALCAREPEWQRRVVAAGGLPADHVWIDPRDVRINVITLQGKRITLAIGLHNTVEALKLTLEDAEGIPPDQQRLIFGGKTLEDERTLAHCGIVNGSTLHLVLRLAGDIGVFVAGHEPCAQDPAKRADAAPGAALLAGPELPSPLPPAEALAGIVATLGGVALDPCDEAPAQPLLDASTVARLVDAVEAAWQQSAATEASAAPSAAFDTSPAAATVRAGVAAGSTPRDFRLLLSPASWEALLPDPATRASLLARLRRPLAAVALRRTTGTGRWINFHRDTAARTVIVPLGDSADTVGGRLVLLQPDGRVVSPVRSPGVPLSHDGDVVHGVSALTSGVRYGLYLLAARRCEEEDDDEGAAASGGE